MFIVQLVIVILALKWSLFTVAALNLWLCANVSDTYFAESVAWREAKAEANANFDEFATHHKQ